MQVDISLVPLHFMYQWAFHQMSEEWEISQPIAVRFCTDHTKAATAICSQGQLCNNRGSCQPALANRFNIRSVSCGDVAVSQANRACSHLISAIPCHSVSLPFSLLLSLPIRVYQNTPGCWINPHSEWQSLGQSHTVLPLTEEKIGTDGF